jgi:hypothetical protein
MPIIPAGQRRYLLEKRLVYLFSYDLPLARGDDDVVFMPVPGGVRLETHLKRPFPIAQKKELQTWQAKEEKLKKDNECPPAVEIQEHRRRMEATDPDCDPWLVYHVLDDITVEGNDAVTGAVRTNRDAIFLPTGEKFGSIEGSVVIETDDDAIIDSRYRGCLSVGTLGVGHLQEASTPSACKNPTRAKLFIAPHFETSYPKYKWLTARQCAGFGIVEFCDGKAVKATIDIYALRSDDVR